MEADEEKLVTFAPVFALALWVSSAGPKAAPPPTHFRLASVGEGVYAAVATPGDRESAGNAGFVIGEDSVLVVDSFASAEAASQLLAEIRRITKLPVRWLVNTHYHLDHVGGNQVFARAGAAIIAHENVRGWIRSENLKFVPGRNGAIESLLPPQITHRDGLTVWLGSRRVDVLARPGHTGGDSVVHVADSDVLFAGDLFWNAAVPNMIDANSAAWLATLEGFLKEFPRATFVAGHGVPGHALNVRFFRDYVFGLRQTVSRAMEEGKSGPGLVEAVLPLHRARFGAWAFFDQFAARNIELAEQEMQGKKRYPPTPGESGAR